MKVTTTPKKLFYLISFIQYYITTVWSNGLITTFKEAKEHAKEKTKGQLLKTPEELAKERRRNLYAVLIVIYQLGGYIVMTQKTNAGTNTRTYIWILLLVGPLLVPQIIYIFRKWLTAGQDESLEETRREDYEENIGIGYAASGIIVIGCVFLLGVIFVVSLGIGLIKNLLA